MRGHRPRVLPRRGWPRRRGFWGRGVGTATAGMGLGSYPAPYPHKAHRGAVEASAAPSLRWRLPKPLGAPKTQSGPGAQRRNRRAHKGEPSLRPFGAALWMGRRDEPERGVLVAPPSGNTGWLKEFRK